MRCMEGNGRHVASIPSVVSRQSALLRIDPVLDTRTSASASPSSRANIGSRAVGDGRDLLGDAIGDRRFHVVRRVDDDESAIREEVEEPLLAR